MSDQRPAKRSSKRTMTSSDRTTIDLLGVMALGELTAFSRLAADAEMAPSFEAKGRLAAIAVEEFQHYELACARLRALGVEPEHAMRPFADAFDEFHTRTTPRDWLEGLVKAYVADGLASDFYAAVAPLVDAETQVTVQRVTAASEREEFLVSSIHTAIAGDAKLAGRLALWARRLMGDAISQAQRAVESRPELSVLVSATEDGTAPVEQSLGIVPAMTEAHMHRMRELGLDF